DWRPGRLLSSSLLAGRRRLAEERVERRLAAILCADVVGYSRLMGADEEKTLAVLKGHRRELIDPLIDQHRGRIFKTTGDGMLIEFASVVDAVRYAVVVQRGMEDRNANLPESECIRFRIGINLGDVMVDEGDMFGDGVNVAARIEALAALAKSASAPRCASRSAKSCRSASPISASTASRTLRGRCGCTASSRLLSRFPEPRTIAEHPRSRPTRPDHRSRYCRSPI